MSSAVSHLPITHTYLSQCHYTNPALCTAKAFYASVWGWNFKPNPPGNTHYTDDCLAMYSYPGEKLMGGIMKRDEGYIRKTKVGVLVYLYAESIDEQVEVCPSETASICCCWLKCG